MARRRGRWRKVKTRDEAREDRLQKRLSLLRQRERFGRGVADLFEIPEDIVLNVPRITIIGNLQMIIENHRGLLQYSSELIRVGTGNGQMTIAGADLAVGSVVAEDLSIMGRFARIEFEEAPDEPPDEDQRLTRARPRRAHVDRLGKPGPSRGGPTGGGGSGR